MLDLCQPETDPSAAVMWNEELNLLHASHPSEKDKLTDSELDTFSGLTIITKFIQIQSESLPQLPSPSSKHDQFFISRYDALSSEPALLRDEIDSAEYVAPMENLMEPDIAVKASEGLDSFRIEKDRDSARNVV